MLTVRGTPRGRPTARNGRVSALWSKPYQLWRAAVERAAADAVRNGAALPAGCGAVSVDLVFTFATAKPERWGRPHTAKPDADNLAKLALDALVRAGALGGDDARAARLTVYKLWGDRGGVTIVAQPAQPAPSARRAERDVAPGWLGGG